MISAVIGDTRLDRMHTSSNRMVAALRIISITDLLAWGHGGKLISRAIVQSGGRAAVPGREQSHPWAISAIASCITFSVTPRIRATAFNDSTVR